MTPAQARHIAAGLLAAADRAERAGQDVIELGETLQRADDAARAELEAAIQAAASKT
jgi:hypothetical protein